MIFDIYETPLLVREMYLFKSFFFDKIYVIVCKMSEQSYTQFTITVPGEYTQPEEERMWEAFSTIGRLVTPEAVAEIKHTTLQEDSIDNDRWQLLGQNIAELLRERTDLVDTRISRKLGDGLAQFKVATVGQVLALSSEQTLVIPHLSSQATKSRQTLPRVMAALRKESQGAIPPMLVKPEPSDIAMTCRTLHDVPLLALIESPQSWDRDIIDSFTDISEIASLPTREILSRINPDYDEHEECADYYRSRASEIKNRATMFTSEFLAAKTMQPQD